jgi:hypothetical protein
LSAQLKASELCFGRVSSTSDLILSTFTPAADEDYSITILSDACADPKASLREELMTNLFPRAANVLTVDQWISSLPAKG